MTSNDNAALYPLGDRGETVDGAADDVRGREVKDEDGDGIGTVADLLVDDREKRVRFLLVEHGGFLGFGQKRTLIPVDAIAEDEVVIDQSRERVAAGPATTRTSSTTGRITPASTTITGTRHTGDRATHIPRLRLRCSEDNAAGRMRLPA